MSTQTPNSNSPDLPAGGLERLFTIKQVVAASSLSRATIYNEIKAKRLRITKVGRATRISESAWRNYLTTVATGSA